MTADVIWQLQKSIYGALHADSALNALVTGIYEYVPQDAAFPYLEIGEMEAGDWSTKTSKGAEVFFSIKVFAREKENKNALSIITRANDLLHDAGLSLTNHNLINIKFQNMAVDRLGDGLTYALESKFRALTEEV